MHVWLITHPITFAVFLFIASIPFSLYATEIKQFLKIPPQKLNIWILKTQLSSAELRLWQLHRLQTELRYFIYTCFRDVSMSVTSLLCVLVLILVPIVQKIVPAQHSFSIWVVHIAPAFFLVSFWLIFLHSVKLGNLLRDVVFGNVEQKLNALNEKIERLRGRLEEKGALVTS